MKVTDHLCFVFPELVELVGWQPWEVHLEFEELLTLAEARENLYLHEDVEKAANAYRRLLHSHQDLIYQEARTAAGSDHARAVAEMERELACYPSTAVPSPWY